MTNLKQFRTINTIILLIFLFIMAYQITNNFSTTLALMGISGFIVGLEWLTLIITDKESAYYMQIREGNIIKFIRIIIQEDKFKKDKDSDNRGK